MAEYRYERYLQYIGNTDIVQLSPLPIFSRPTRHSYICESPGGGLAAVGLWSPGVKRRLLKPLVYLLVAAQLLLAVPAMAAAHGAAGSATAAMHCDKCPCCPDALDSMKDCLTTCMLGSVAAPGAGTVFVVATAHQRVDSATFTALVSLSDPPLKPPPIR
jgi:hypothetical protein